jgi:hypothetical protein
MFILANKLRDFHIVFPAERLNYLTPEMLEFRESVLAEWNTNLQNKYGPEEGARRMALMMAYHLECDVTTSH